jgi:hypothetical protein
VHAVGVGVEVEVEVGEGAEFSAVASGRKRIRPGREAAAYLGLVTAMDVSIALAIPDAGILALASSMGTPLIAVGLITLFRTPRGARRSLWGTFGLRRAGWRSWPAPFVLGVLAVFVVPFGVADVALEIRAFDPTVGVLVLSQYGFDQTMENATGAGAPPSTCPRSQRVVEVTYKALYALVTGALADPLVAPTLRSRREPSATDGCHVT